MKRFIALMPLPLAIVCRLLASNQPEWIEKNYVSVVYQAIAAPVSSFFAILHFPIIEILVIIFSLFLIYLLFAKKFFVALSLCLLVPAIFIGGWGLTYFRLPLEQTLLLDVRDSSVEELSALSEKLTRDANAMYTEPSGNLLSPANNALNSAAKSYPIPVGSFGEPKFALSSPLMSKFLIEGITSPFTLEALVNRGIPTASIPFVACHEAAHIRGFAREEDANIIAYLACEASDDPYYRYSGAVSALLYTLRALHSADAEAYVAVHEMISPQVRADIDSYNAYWAPYHQTKAAEVGTRINDAYLQTMASGDQSTRSYGRIVDLLLALSRKEEM